MCLKNGQWDHQVLQCQANCGRVATHSTPMTIGGKTSNVTSIPWHVGIYLNEVLICGGTIISERVVISAAHCFSDATDKIHEIALETFQVAAGKFKRALSEKESPAPQIMEVQEVRIPST